MRRTSWLHSSAGAGGAARFPNLTLKTIWKNRVLSEPSTNAAFNGSRPIDIQHSAVGNPSSERRTHPIDFEIRAKQKSKFPAPEFLREIVEELESLDGFNIRLLTDSEQDGWTIPIPVLVNEDGEIDANLFNQPVLRADETPLPMLKPGHGKTHRAYLWSYCSPQLNPFKAVIFDYAESLGGKHAELFLERWRGTLVYDDFKGYKALFASGVTEAGCMAHARRKFHELWINHSSQIAGEVLDLFGRLYEIEREAASLDCERRHRLRKQQANPVLEALYRWLQTQDQRVPKGSATARAIGYSLNRWQALTYYLNDPAVPIDNNWMENQIRPIALGRKNWMFAGSLHAGKLRRR